MCKKGKKKIKDSGWFECKSQCHWGSGSRDLLRIPEGKNAAGKKLFVWWKVLVLMDDSLLPEGKVSKSLWPGWEGSATILPGIEGYSQSPSQQHRTRLWWRMWGWTWWWQCRSAASLSFAGWTSSAVAGRTSSVELFSWGIWCSAFILGPGWWWCPGSSRTPQSRLGSHTRWWGWVGLGFSWSPWLAPLSLER